MSLHHKRKTIREWNDDEKKCWNRRSGLEKKLIILLIVIGISTIGFLVYYSIIRTVGTAEICNTPGCLLAASQILAHIDTSIDPCEDFLQFSCGKLIEQTHGDMIELQKLGVDNLIERQLKEIIEEPINEEDHYLIKSHKQLFQACLNETAVEEDSLDIFKGTIEEIGGWPVVVGYHWKAKLFDWQEMVCDLRKRGYDYFMMLSVYVEIMEINAYSVKIIEPFIKSIKDQHKDLYIKYMVDVAVAFGADPDFATLEMKSVFDFMTKLEKLLQGTSSWVFNTTTNKWSTDEESRIFTVEEFQRNHNQIDWLEFINTIISPLANISSDDYVLFPKSEFLDKFFYLLYRTSKRTQANYIIWMVLQDIMPYMPKQLKQLNANYTCSTAQQTPIQDRSDFCREVVVDSFIPGFTEIIYARKYLTEERKMQVEEIFMNIKSELSESIMETTWMDEENKENCSAKVDDMTAIIGLGEDYLNDTIFDDLIIPNDTLQDFGNDSFLNLFLKTKKRVADSWYSQIALSAKDSNIQLTLMVSPLNVFYLAPKNKLVLSPKILQGVYYNDDNPNYVNYAALGSLIGYNLVSDMKEDFWTEESLDEQIECFAQNIENSGLANRNIQNHTITAKQTLPFNVGLGLAYGAYRKWVEENTEEAQLPGIEFGPNQLFWISAMLPQCHMSTEDEINTNFVAAVVLNNPKFADDFSCSVESRMNPSEECEVF